VGDPADESQPIFVLVHGTWARRASWTLLSSPMSMALRDEWPAAQIYRFNWTGVNGARHRLAASEALAEGLSDLQRRYPNSSIVAMGHSHGGTVLSWAVTRLERGIAACIYLNTPFPQMLNRKPQFGFLPGMMSFMMFWLVIFVVSILPLLDALAVALQHLRGSLGSAITAHTEAIQMAIFYLTTLVGTWQWYRFWNRIQKLRRDTIARINGRRLTTRELGVFVVGDEANALLGSIYFSQWFVHKIILRLFLFSMSCQILRIPSVRSYFVEQLRVSHYDLWTQNHCLVVACFNHCSGYFDESDRIRP
jgi:pimeloyl-ACP methyl ester carboxylesterase